MKRESVGKGGGQEVCEINVVPLADISLVLLIILMLITPMVMQSMIQVSAPRGAVAAKAEEVSQEKPLFVEVRPDGYLLNTKLLPAAELDVILRGELSRKSDRTVLFTAAPGVKHGQMVTGLDIAKQAGAVKLSLLKRARS